LETVRSTFPELSSCSGVLTIELNPAAGTPPAPLSREAAAHVAGYIAEDLSHILGGIDHLSMVVPGALYDQTELLRPAFPLFSALEDIFRGTLRDADYTPQLIALGTDGERFPVAALNPIRRPGSGPLLLLPFIFAGYQQDISALSNTMENRLLQNGDVSSATRQAVQQAFTVQAVNMSYATPGDLCALLEVQLENNGFAPLWQLLEHALFQRPGIRWVILASGNSYLLSDGEVYAPFYTFDDWAQFGPGRDVDAAQLGTGYSTWVRAHRQYTLTLEAYGLPLHLVMGSPALEQADDEAALAAVLAATRLDGDLLVETVISADCGSPEQRLIITNQYQAELGTLAYTVLALDQNGTLVSLENYYPLRLQGLETSINRLIQRSEGTGIERQVLHPQTLVYSASERCLSAAADSKAYPPSRHH
jgi:hypothetical protein